jgi:hypothetical protein
MSGQPETITVFLTNAVRTSAGTGPGPMQLPPAEAAALVADRIAVYGSAPPMGFNWLLP